MQQNQAAAAYQQVAKRTTNPRDLEANLLTRSAANLQRLRDNWEDDPRELNQVLTFNRKLWNVFINSATNESHPLAAPIRQNIANLGLFVMKRSHEIMLRPEPQKLDVLININRELAAGLRAQQPS
ncbi:flagellar biosynthesis regulator FlaF [Devosia nitrariae]|uniref:Flagellar biosynthesis regulatory protein FlaF n=1 Tax=Devosia nitrariae TaxID=2071872 RepID=A0ABQ5WB46_9HYPH|nr:flagellar biosynthesis regulator FlaF [Devosia nitrariae]GLQ57313.1 flagellar biosynthesis regulatory protein FlaF [Devosia nitrariae]